MLWLWILIGNAAVLVLFVVVLYNRLVRFRNRTENAWAQAFVHS